MTWRSDAVSPGVGRPRLLPSRCRRPARYVDTTGTGNAVNADHPVALRMIMDSLATGFTDAVDGFRFDLATTLGRKEVTFDPLAGSSP